MCMYQYVLVQKHDTCMFVHMRLYVHTHCDNKVRRVLGPQPHNLGGSGWAPPNGDAAVDALLSALAHETAEAATDPDTRSGYFDK